MNLPFFLGFHPFFQQQLDDSEQISRIARVAAEHRGGFDVWTANGVSPAKLAGRVHTQRREIPAVGDWVVLREPPAEDGPAVIQRVLQRRTLFTRGAAGREGRVQAIAANVDLVFAVTGLDADFNIRRLERYLARIHASGAAAAVILNKADLCEDLQQRLAEVEQHCRHVPIIVTSAARHEGVDEVESMICAGTTVAFVGSSGAGKSTLINALSGAQMATGSVGSDGRGRHTTTHRQLIALPQEAVVIDTPGMRELQLMDLDGLEEVFDDIAALASRCRFRNCQHDSEPGCAVRAAAPYTPALSHRIEHLRKLQREARSNEVRSDVVLKRRAEREWGRMSDEAAKHRRWKEGKPR